MKDLTLRQVEVIRAVMMTGTIQGAARLLNVSAPGISRLVKHTEESLGLRLFERKAGLFLPAAEAHSVFEIVHQVYRQVENLNSAVSSLRKGKDVRLALASSPSVGQVVAARAIHAVRQRFPALFVDLNILKIEETADYLLLERGECVFMTSSVENAALTSEKIASGRIIAILPEGHRLAARHVLSVRDFEGENFVGVDPGDPYGAALAQPFRLAGIEPHHDLRGRFAQTVISLVRNRLGVALIDQFSVSEPNIPGIVRRPIEEVAMLDVFIVKKRERELSSFAQFAVDEMRRALREASQAPVMPNPMSP